MKRIIYFITLALLCGVVALGCAKQVVSSAEEEAAAKAEESAEAATEAEGKETGEEVTMVEEGDVTGMEEIARPETPTVEEALAEIEDIYFDYDRYEIKKVAQTKLSKLADLLVSGGGSVVIEGHCDDRGTNEYNLALGDRRANAAKDFLVASGVSPSKIGVVSYGEERPQCAQQSESCWSKNRRAHFRVSGID